MQIKNVKIKEGYSVKELGGEFCLVYESDTNNGAVPDMPSINETGIFIWDRLTKGITSLEGLVKEVSKKNDIDDEEALEDVGEFIAKLINGKIVDISQ